MNRRGEATPQQAHCPGSRRAGLLLLLLLPFTADVLDEHAWDVVWPALIILVGVVIVARWAGRTIPGGVSREDAPTLDVDALTVFGGVEITHEKE